MSEFFHQTEMTSKILADSLSLVKLNLFKENAESYYNKYEKFEYFKEEPKPS